MMSVSRLHTGPRTCRPLVRPLTVAPGRHLVHSGAAGAMVTPVRKGFAMRRHKLRALWLTSILTASFIVGVAAGLLCRQGGMNAPAAVLAGAGAFAESVLLLITVIQYARAIQE